MNPSRLVSGFSAIELYYNIAWRDSISKIKLFFEHFPLQNRGERQPFSVTVNANHAARLDLPCQDAQCQRILQLALDQTLKRTGTIIGIIPRFSQVFTRGFSHLQAVATLGHTTSHVAQLDIDYLGQVLAAEHMKDNDLVDAVEKLRPEVRLQDACYHITRNLFPLPQPQLAPQVAGHNH